MMEILLAFLGGIRTNIVSGAQRMTPLSGIWNIVTGWANIPWLAGIISIIIISVSCVIVADTLVIKNTFNLILISAIMCTSPAMINAFVYGYGGLPFAISLLFASYAVREGFRGSIGGYLRYYICLTIVVMTYTAYASWSAVLIIIISVDGFIHKSVPGITIIKKELTLLALSVFSVLTDIFFCRIVISISGQNFQGRVTDSLYSKSMIGILNTMVTDCISYWKSFFTHIYLDFTHISVYLCLIVLIFYFFIIKADWGGVKKKIIIGSTALVLVHVALIPIAYDLLRLIWGTGHQLTGYAIIVWSVLLIVLLDRIVQRVDAEESLRLIKIKSVILPAIFLLLSLYSYHLILAANVGYLRVDVLANSAEQTLNRIAMRLESIEGYTPGVTKVFFAGYLGKYGSADMTMLSYSESISFVGNTVHAVT